MYEDVYVRKLKKPVIFLIAFGLILFLLWWSLLLIEPRAKVTNLLISNITDHQVTISWTTTIPTKGTIIVSSDSKFPILPILAKNIQKDDGEKNTKKMGYYATHHTTIGSLQSQAEYNFRIYQGQKKVYEGQFNTGSTLPSLNNPNPIYGRILKSDKKTAVVGAMVYLTVVNEASDSALLSTLTNSKGGWSLDLGNLRSKDLQTYFKIDKKIKEKLIVTTSDKGGFKAQTSYGADKPWPDILLK